LILNVTQQKSENYQFKDAGWEIIQGNLHHISSESIIVTDTAMMSGKEVVFPSYCF